MTPELDFASRAWIERIKQLLAELVAQHRHELRDARFTIAETFTDVPPDGIRTSWAARIADGTVTFPEGPVEDADFTVLADHAAALPGAQLIYAEASPEQLAAVAQHRDRMIAAGRLVTTGKVSVAGRPLLDVLRTLHDTMARETR